MAMQRVGKIELHPVQMGVTEPGGIVHRIGEFTTLTSWRAQYLGELDKASADTLREVAPLVRAATEANETRVSEDAPHGFHLKDSFEVGRVYRTKRGNIGISIFSTAFWDLFQELGTLGRRKAKLTGRYSRALALGANRKRGHTEVRQTKHGGSYTAKMHGHYQRSHIGTYAKGKKAGQEKTIGHGVKPLYHHRKGIRGTKTLMLSLLEANLRRVRL